MTAIFRANRHGATAVEFALIAPVLILAVGGGLGLGLATWTKNALQQSVIETARCVAIGSPSCSTSIGTCDSAIPAVCYLEVVASRRGVSKVSGSQVAIDPVASIGGVSFTVVTVDYATTIFGYKFVLHVDGHFPNPE